MFIVEKNVLHCGSTLIVDRLLLEGQTIIFLHLKFIELDGFEWFRGTF